MNVGTKRAAILSFMYLPQHATCTAARITIVEQTRRASSLAANCILGAVLWAVIEGVH